MADRIWSCCIAACLALFAANTARADGKEALVDVEAAQAILAVQELDGWLLHSTKQSNPIALELVGPHGVPTRRWFYFIPAEGQATILVHRSEVEAFRSVAGKKLEYTGNRDLKSGLRTMLKGAKSVAMEYAPKSGIPSLTKVDAGTIALLRTLGVTIQSSADLVQFTKSLWGPRGRIAHYVAAHHLSKLRQEALSWLAKQIRAGNTVTERDVQRFIMRGYRVRGLEGDPPMVSTGAHTANARYRPTRTNVTAIARGDLLVLQLAARVKGGARPIVASQSWVAYVGDAVPERYARVFKVVAGARDAAIALISDRVSRKRVIRGFEPDQKARSIIGDAGFADRFPHRTGHSLDTSLLGDGANLDGLETHDSRNLVQDSGFTIGPAVYIKGDFGIRSTVSAYIGRAGLEVTSAVQDSITPVLAARKTP